MGNSSKREEIDARVILIGVVAGGLGAVILGWKIGGVGGSILGVLVGPIIGGGFAWVFYRILLPMLIFMAVIAILYFVITSLWGVGI